MVTNAIARHLSDKTDGFHRDNTRTTEFLLPLIEKSIYAVDIDSSCNLTEDFILDRQLAVR